jgi:hypothetical protein
VISWNINCFVIDFWDCTRKYLNYDFLQPLLILIKFWSLECGWKYGMVLVVSVLSIPFLAMFLKADDNYINVYCNEYCKNFYIGLSWVQIMAKL